MNSKRRISLRFGPHSINIKCFLNLVSPSTLSILPPLQRPYYSFVSQQPKRLILVRNGRRLLFAVMIIPVVEKRPRLHLHSGSTLVEPKNTVSPMSLAEDVRFGAS